MEEISRLFDTVLNIDFIRAVISNPREKDGIINAPCAFELKQPKEPLLMQCKHCIRLSLGHCLKHERSDARWQAPLYLRLPDGRRFKLQFDCNKCQMNVYAET